MDYQHYQKFNGSLRTREGRRARFIAETPGLPAPLVFIVGSRIEYYYAGGKFMPRGEHENDIVAGDYNDTQPNLHPKIIKTLMPQV